MVRSPPALAQTRRERRARAQRQLRARRSTVMGVLMVAVFLAVFAAGPSLPGRWDASPGGSAPGSPSPTPAAPSPSPTPTPSPSPTPSPEPVLALPGDVPESGPGTFTYVDGEGEVLGDGDGRVRRYRVGVEDGTGDDLAAFAAVVAETLAHPQGWTAGDYRFQQVSDGAGHEFTVYLATSQTTGSRCAAAGLYVLAPGFPEGGVSCSPGGQVILNLSRWRLSVPHFVDAGVPLETYRQMLVNHEVGHELGYGHDGCPGAGEPAPVMMQQTLRLDGCVANPWPYLD